MDNWLIAENIAKQLTQVWTIHRDPGFVDYLLQTFGCEPLKPVRFSGIFSMQMIGGYFFSDLPAGPGPIVERLWLMDDTGFRESGLDELRPVENVESDNPLVVYEESRVSYNPIRSQPLLLAYPRIKFAVRDDKIIYYEMFGFGAGCSKVGNVVVNDRVIITELGITTTSWQGRFKEIRPSYKHV